MAASGNMPVNSTLQSKRQPETRAYFKGWLYSTLLFLMIALLPFQKLGIEVETTVVDLSNIVFLIFVASIFFGSRNIQHNGFFLLFLVGFFLIHLTIFIFSQTPLSRYVSGAVWMFSLMIIYGRRKNIMLNEGHAFVAVISSMFILVFSVVFEIIVLGEDRPSGLMAEPSPAGLLALSGAAGLLIAARFSNKSHEKYLCMFGAAILIAMSYYLKTTHFLSFIVTIFTISLFSKSYNIRTLITIAALITALYFTIGQDSHYLERADISAPTTNLSLLSWLQGFDQMKESLISFPVVGVGLGGTGYFYFQSGNSDLLFLSGIADLNRLDAYSGFFRLVIELGPVFMAMFLVVLWLRLKEIWSAVSLGLLPQGTHAMRQVFLFTFSFSLLVGILLKEPTWSRSQVVVGFLLFFTTPLGVYRSKALNMKFAIPMRQFRPVSRYVRN